ncbi:LPXTG cell wall anchor domain-containing protein [Sulfuracidifex metallicus]|uniref:LPXTG cell wall anchor domain-containing protein n=1 Tax=Sulfuracidifex metallicus DSM 6482 = JCM 9184 TaxID=523847 RepID=A0A6A9QXH6_SULME|nr:LPXTG cell wall anchor domain-containing protein [Sulfuracidifex metallicus]MUN29732.1 LPXTG cell wall anchor domain-containing protein [Sulfuracidifex metallicus DSM 6482 = JCM 9184]WOE51892.1 LPXTG cell wall anchor domain-containing protein [Sulfuracidifex metallicus DSM 6482 = JCM 9184]
MQKPLVDNSTSNSAISHTITSSHALITSTDINLALIGVGISILIGVFLVYRRR